MALWFPLSLSLFSCFSISFPLFTTHSLAPLSFLKRNSEKKHITPCVCECACKDVLWKLAHTHTPKEYDRMEIQFIYSLTFFFVFPPRIKVGNYTFFRAGCSCWCCYFKEKCSFIKQHGLGLCRPWKTIAREKVFFCISTLNRRMGKGYDIL